MNTIRTWGCWMSLALMLAGAIYLVGKIPAEQRCDGKEPAAADRDISPSVKKDLHDLELRQAKLFNRLVQVNFEALEDLNRKIPGTVSFAAVDRLRGIVTLSALRLKALESHNSEENLWLISAQVDLEMAEKNLQRGLEISKQAGMSNERGVERLRLARDMAQVNVERAQLAVKSPAPLADLQWQMDRLHDAIGDLTNSISNITSRR